MALPIGPDGKTVQSAVDDLVQWVRSGEPEYEFERRARNHGVEFTVPEPPAYQDLHDRVLTIGDESVRSDYYIGTDKFVWTYRREKDGKIVVFSSPEDVPPSSMSCYARFLGYARAMTKETTDG